MNWAIPTIFEITSLGEASMLVQAFNGLAAITNADGFVNMTRAAFLVGLLAFGARAVMTGRFELTSLLASLIIYALMFGPRATVIVIDNYSGATTPVANVPVGVAAPFALVSRTGKFFAETFESAFSVIGPDSQYLGAGYLDALSVLLRMRDIKPGTANSPDVNNTADLVKSVKNYIVGCVYYDIELANNGIPSQITRENLQQTKDIWAELKTTYPNISVMLFLPKGSNQGQPFSCKNAYIKLSEFFVAGSPWNTNYFDPWLRSVIDAPLGSRITAQDRIQGALNSINLATVDANTFAINAFLSTILRTTDESFYVSRNDVASAIISSQAQNQRNVQWTGERTMFEKVARPVTAFIEVFLVAATPLMAFAVAAFGVAGVSTLGRYLLLHFWVTLWAPTLAIANMYTYSRVVAYIDHIKTVTALGKSIQPESMLGMDYVMQRLQTEFATGSMLAASTPMLTLLLIYGSSQVASMLASKMSSAEQIDAKAASPSVMQPAPAYSMESMYAGNPLIGPHTRGAGIPTIAMSQTAVATRQRAEQYVASTQAALNDEVSSSYTDSKGNQVRVEYSRGRGWQVQGGGFNALTASWNVAQQAAQRFSKDVNEQEALTKAASKAIMDSSSIGASTRGITLGLAGLSAERRRQVAEQIGSETKLGASQAMSFLDMLQQSAQADDRTGREYRKSLDAKGNWNKAQAVTFGGSADDSQRIGESLTAARSAQRSYQEASQINSLASYHDSMNPLQLLDRYKTMAGADKNPNWRGNLAGLYSQMFGADPQMQAAKLAQTEKVIGRAIPALNGPTGAADRKAAAMLFVMGAPENDGAHLIAKGISMNNQPAMELARNNDVVAAGKGVAANGAALEASPQVRQRVGDARTNAATVPAQNAVAQQQGQTWAANANSTPTEEQAFAFAGNDVPGQIRNNFGKVQKASNQQSVMFQQGAGRLLGQNIAESIAPGAMTFNDTGDGKIDLRNPTLFQGRLTPLANNNFGTRDSVHAHDDRVNPETYVAKELGGKKPPARAPVPGQPEPE